MNIWITGAGGLIGNYLAQTGSQYFPKATIRGLTRSALELANHDAVRAEFLRSPPQLLIHCAALSRNPDCDANPGLAHELNVEVTARLAALAANIPFFFFSTDLVFDGRLGRYEETAAVNPLGIYAETKVLAERIVLENPNHTVIRTSLNGGISPTGDRGFNEVMRRAWLAGKCLSLFTDEYRSPVFAGLTAKAVWELARSHRKGIYHVSGNERLSRWEIGQLVAARWPELNPQTRAGTLQEYQGSPRAPDTSLNCRKVQALLPFELTGLTSWLKAHPREKF